MCGILGGINFEKEKYSRAKLLLKHRGPDENGDFSFENLYLFHARLGIQDIANGLQPFHSNGYTIIFNGEIYNHLALRTRYNLKCHTNSDTETLLLLYQKLGKTTLDLLDGMFAFAIFDSSSRKLFLARDRAGEKPLYIFDKGKQFAFSSELNALSSLIDTELENENFYQYLRYSFVSKSTPYKNVYEIPAGGWCQIDLQSLVITSGKWWEIINHYNQDSFLNISETLEKIDILLNSSIENRLNNSDLEVGTFLSGGIDSGLVTAIGSKYRKRLKTFTIAFKGQYDESGLAQLVANKYGTDHSRIEISFTDLQKDLESILANYGEPFSDSSAIPSYYVSREAKKHLTVILNGDGADELFGGYRRYVPFSKYDFFSQNKYLSTCSDFISKLLPLPGNKKSNYNYIYRLMDFAGKDPLHAYLSATVDSFEGYDVNFNSAGDQLADIEDYIQKLNSQKLSGLKKIMCLDFNFLFANDLLVKMDIATMAHSLEGRTPFLSKEILEFAPTINDKFKINGITTKYLLRELAKKYLPEELINQPKRGFEVPLLSWMENDLKEITFDYLSGNTFSETFIDKTFIKDVLDKKLRVAPDKRAKMLWTLLALEIWYKKCYQH